MEVKKNSEVDGDKVKSSMTIIGLSYVAALTLAVFTFGQVNLEEEETNMRQKMLIPTVKATIKMSHRHRHHRKKWKFKLLQNHLKR